MYCINVCESSIPFRKMIVTAALSSYCDTRIQNYLFHKDTKGSAVSESLDHWSSSTNEIVKKFIQLKYN